MRKTYPELMHPVLLGQPWPSDLQMGVSSEEEDLVPLNQEVWTGDLAPGKLSRSSDSSICDVCQPYLTALKLSLVQSSITLQVREVREIGVCCVLRGVFVMQHYCTIND